MASDIFILLNEKAELFNPATQATILAKYSRSAESARDISKKISNEEADKFYSKWVIAYGHSSVAELATIPVCFENVSMIASKFIESYPRAGYSEKSTRYQVFSPDSFVTPPGGSRTMKEFASKYYDLYNKMMPRMLEIAALKFGLEPDENTFKMAKVKARALDNLRYLLPAGTGTNLAGVFNLRDIRYLVSDARASDNTEIKEIGEGVFKASSSIAPSLLSVAEPNWFEPKTVNIGHDIAIGNKSNVSVHKYSGDTKSFKEMIHNRYGMPWEVFSDHMNKRINSPVPEAFKSIRMSFDIIMDYGAYRDLQRHRRCDQISEFLSPYIGYEVPDDIKGSILEKEYIQAMESFTLYNDESVVHVPWIYQYLVPMGFLHRSYFEMDLKELYYMIELRTKPQGHISYRRIAYQMYEKAMEIFPELMQWCKPVAPHSIGEHN